MGAFLFGCDEGVALERLFVFTEVLQVGF